MFLRCFICDYRYPEADMVTDQIVDADASFEEVKPTDIYVCKPCATIHHNDQKEPSDEQEAR